jgi:hypothetical protein
MLREGLALRLAAPQQEGLLKVAVVGEEAAGQLLPGRGGTAQAAEQGGVKYVKTY